MRRLVSSLSMIKYTRNQVMRKSPQFPFIFAISLYLNEFFSNNDVPLSKSELFCPNNNKYISDIIVKVQKHFPL